MRKPKSKKVVIRKAKKRILELPWKQAKKFEIIGAKEQVRDLGSESLEDELDFNGIESSQDFRKLLSSSDFKSMGIENGEIQPLEKTAIFLPRQQFQENRIEIEDRNYASTNYNEKYGENNYASKTPGYVAKKPSPESGAEKHSGKKNK